MKSSLKLRFSARARRELRAILQYSLESWGAAQRDAYAAAINSTLTSLTMYPELGRSRDEFGAGVRSLPIEQHVIYYRVDGTILTVLRVVHGRMHIAGTLDQ